MTKCKCGSYAINLNRGGRGDDKPELCDVCYWKDRVRELEALLRESLRRFHDYEMDVDGPPSFDHRVFMRSVSKALQPEEKPE